MANVNIVSIFSIVLICTLLFGSFSFVSDEISDKNTRLSENSETILLQYKTDVNANLNVDSLATPGVNSNVSSGGEAEDFSREYRESKAIINQDKSRFEKILSVPQLFVNSLGFETNDLVSFYLILVGILLAFVISIAIYIAFRTGVVQNG